MQRKLHSAIARLRNQFEVSKRLSCFDELNDVPQGTGVHKKKSGLFKGPGVPYHGQQSLVECSFKQSPNFG